MGRAKTTQKLQVEVVPASDQGIGRLCRALDILLAAAGRAEVSRQAEEAGAKLLAPVHAPFEQNSATDAEKEEPPRRGPVKDSPIGGEG